MLAREVDEAVPISSTTRWRQEKLHRFPLRVKVSSRLIGYHRAEIESWLRDPEAWVARQAAAVAQVVERDDGQFQLGHGETASGPFPSRQFAETVAIKEAHLAASS
jgi:predicted DNA-binding transcriptional regulator AlpA